MTGKPRKSGRIAPWRARTQWLATVLLLTIPFIEVRGDSLLRLDAASRTLLFFGARIRIEEFYLVLIVILIFVFAFLFVTMLFGRVWCGWLCPQTAICDLADWIDLKAESFLPGRVLPAMVRQLAYLLIASLVASNLVWYFIRPPDFFDRLPAGEIGTVAGIALLTMFLLVYLDLALVRRRFCKTVCPYGRIQLLTTGSGTLTLEFDKGSQHACLRCGACVRACPMGIDIRKGMQVECINCGRCLDACRDVRERRGDSGLIRYTFGSARKEGAAKRKALLLGGVSLLLVALFAGAVALRKEATLKVQRAAGGEVKRLPDGSLVNFYTAYVENRSTAPGIFSLQAGDLPGHRLELIGPVRDLQIPDNSNRKIDLALKILPAPKEREDVELKLVKDGKTVSSTTLPLLIE